MIEAQSVEPHRQVWYIERGVYGRKTCPRCEGNRTINVRIVPMTNYEVIGQTSYPCPECKGRGLVDNIENVVRQGTVRSIIHRKDPAKSTYTFLLFETDRVFQAHELFDKRPNGAGEKHETTGL